MATASRKKGKGTSGARIHHAAHRLPWFRTTRFLYSAVVCGVLVIGILVGTGLGLWLAPSETVPSPQSTVQINQNDIDEATLPKGPPLSYRGQKPRSGCMKKIWRTNQKHCARTRMRPQNRQQNLPWSPRFLHPPRQCQPRSYLYRNPRPQRTETLKTDCPTRPLWRLPVRWRIQIPGLPMPSH
jgi:hypothetical protein